MLLSLGIRDFVLIDRLDLDAAAGLSVLTGETGAGKSILLDSLSLALGGRGESGIVRGEAPQAVITAEFDVSDDHPARALLIQNDLEAEGVMILRRSITREGRSRATINDQAVSIGLLREVGSLLAEIQGQFDSHGLLDPATHRTTLDVFAQAAAQLTETAARHTAWRQAFEARLDAQRRIAEAQAQEEHLRQVLSDLDALAPKQGEEAELAAQRLVLQQRDKVLGALTAATGELTGDRGAEAQLARALRGLSRLGSDVPPQLTPMIAALERAASELADATALLERLSGSADLAEGRLEKLEERLYALRSAARKHGVATDDLATLRDRLAEDLAAIEGGGSQLSRLVEAETLAQAEFRKAAEALSKIRVSAAARLDQAVMAELPPLKLERARFRTRLEPLPEEQWSAAGAETVTFEVTTNPGAEPGPINRIASGGELSRFMLALKLVLAETSPVETLIFDEVDSGIGGAVAAAVGERLARLGQRMQVLVVTHSPQVAALGAQHWRVEKSVANGRTTTAVELLGPSARQEEIARMLSGAVITDEARAAAASLMAKAG